MSKTVEKRVYQEAGSKCSFCDVQVIESLQVHHIDGNSANNALENLFVVCANCHGEITRGVRSESDVRTKKREIQWSHISRKPVTAQAAVNVSITASSFRGDIAQNLTKIISSKAPRVAYPAGSIGADLPKKGYIDYLIGRYFDFRKADASFGVHRPFSHAELHRTIQNEFGNKTFFNAVEVFESLSDFLKGRISRTILGKKNTGDGVANFHSFEHHLSKQNSKLPNQPPA